MKFVVKDHVSTTLCIDFFHTFKIIPSSKPNFEGLRMIIKSKKEKKNKAQKSRAWPVGKAAACSHNHHDMTKDRILD